MKWASRSSAMILVARISPEDPPRAAVVEDTWAHWHHKRWTCIEYALLASGLDMDWDNINVHPCYNPTIFPLIADRAGIQCRIAACAVKCRD